MNILHIVSGNLNGGAAKGAYHLHKGLLSFEINSFMLSSGIEGGSYENVNFVMNSIGKKINGIMKNYIDRNMNIFYKNRNKHLFSTGMFGFDFTKTEEYKKSDIVHLHWINNGFVNMKDLSKVNKPIIWTIRDMWPVTGGCHYAMDCDNYKRGCGKCKQLGSKSTYDLSRYILYRKKKYIPSHTKVVGISSWISEQAKRSDVFSGFDIRTIYNNIDMTEFFPLDKWYSKKSIGLNTNKKIILAGAKNIGDFYKGFDKLIDAYKNIDPKDYYLCFFGRASDEIVKSVDNMGFEYRFFGQLEDSISLRILYSASDVFVAPSIMEAFGKTLAEAMSCQTPVVCFDATGPKDIVDHKINGYRARPFDPADLAKGIEWVLEHTEYERLCRNAREKVVREFDSRVVARKYIELYRECLRG